jgi:GT2 family glycosyltransferase/glycosyltransferase involved in cell wall biosynthesis
MAKPRAVVVGRHLYGAGGGAVATSALARGLTTLGYDVAMFSQMAVAKPQAEALGKAGISFQYYFKGCSKGADLLVNIDHFEYEPPLAALNLAHIFHPHKANRPDPEYAAKYRFSANSQYTADWIKAEWDIAAPVLYVPIGREFYQTRKRNLIMHVSRISRPTPLADKGHTAIIRTFQALCDAGLENWELAMVGSIEDAPYLAQLQAQAQGFPVRFYANPPDSVVRDLYAQAAFYWHMTGVDTPQEHGAQEHLGLTTLEAMASGAVPIVYGSGGQPEIVHQGIDGILCQDPYSVGQATMNLIGNLSQWSGMSRHAVAAAAPWQDWNAFGTRLGSWIEGVEIPALSAPQKQTFAETKGYILGEDVCVVIPTLGLSTHLDDTVRTLLKTAPDVGQIIIVNNGSPWQLKNITSERLRKQDRVVGGDDVLSFAESNMLVLNHTKKSVLLACNDDLVFFDPGWLDALLDALNAGAGVVGAKLLFPDGRLQHAGGSVSWDRRDLGYHRWYGAEDFPGANQREEVPFVTGALLLTWRDLWQWRNLGGGIGYEDTDLCLQAKALGYTVVYEPAARAVHLQGQTRRLDEAADTTATELNRAAFRATWFERFHKLYPWWLEGGHAEASC